MSCLEFEWTRKDMKWKIANPQTRLNLSSAIILFAGLSSSIYIYLTARNVSDTVLEFEETKKYLRDLELYGGKANVLTDRAYEMV
jgi:hypothetical protein